MKSLERPPQLPSSDEELPEQEKVSRREFLKQSTVVGGVALIEMASKSQATGEEKRQPLTVVMEVAAMGLDRHLKARQERLPEGIERYLMQFETYLKDEVVKVNTPERREVLDEELQSFAIWVNRGAPAEGQRVYSESLTQKPSKELIRDLSLWAREREAQHRVQKNVLPSHYETVVRNNLKNGDRSAAAKIIREGILENINRARTQDSRSHISHLRQQLDQYGFVTPKRNEAGELELWVPLAKSLKKQEEYWQRILEKLK
jgi:hypothetical protein